MTIYLSQSSLTSFFQGLYINSGPNRGKTLGCCPAAWKYDRQWQPVGGEHSVVADTGILVHKMLAGEVDPEKVEDENAKMFYGKLHALRNALDLRVREGHVEHTQFVSLLPGIKWIRRIDMIAGRPFGRLDIADWKTTGALFKPLNGIGGVVPVVPQAMTFQAIGSLIPPSQKDLDRLDLKRWPKNMIFLVAGFRGPAGMFEYTYNKKDHENLLQAAKIVADVIKGGVFPKVRGKHCHDCPMKEICFDAPDWRRRFEKKKYSE